MCPFFNSSRPPQDRLGRALSRLDGLVDWERLARQGRGRRLMRVSVAPARDLCERLGVPQRSFFPVHVAGSKGKGSVCALVATALRRAGYSTGVYGSPHVERVNERIALDDGQIADDALAAVLEQTLDAREDAVAEGTEARDATWFDVLTASGFLALSRANAEMGVVECGLGGRLDSTNVLQAPVCVITCIELEHTAILGDTREEIAAEKAGILSPGAVLVTSLAEDDPAGRRVMELAEQVGAIHRPVRHAAGASLHERNRAVALAALAAIAETGGGARLQGRTDLLDEEACERARLPGRCERRTTPGGVPVVLDGAHVPASMELLLEELCSDSEGPSRLVCVFGTGQEKDAVGLLKHLVPRVDSLVCTSVGPSLYQSAEGLLRHARELGCDAQIQGTPRAAFEEAVRLADPDGWVLVTGSLHLIGAVRGLTRPLHPSHADDRL